MAASEYGMGRCAVCTARIPVGRLMCGPHWRKVSKPTQRDVYSALDGWMDGAVTLDDLRSTQERAIAEVAA